MWRHEDHHRVSAHVLPSEFGTLLVSRGYEFSPSFVERVRNYSPKLLEKRVRIERAGPMTTDRDSSHQERD
jgi:hypothetical protein